MDPAIWSLLPMEILEMILLWVPFSTLIRFASTSKHFQAILWQRAFRTSWLNNHITEVGFFVEVWRPYEIEILYKFINYVGHTSFLHITNPETIIQLNARLVQIFWYQCFVHCQVTSATLLLAHSKDGFYI